MVNDGDTVVDDGLSVQEGNDTRTPDASSPHDTIEETAKKKYRQWVIFLFILAILASILVTLLTAIYHAQTNHPDGNISWNIQGNEHFKETNSRLNRTLEYLVAKNVSKTSAWVPSNSSTVGTLEDTFLSSYSPQYKAALWISIFDKRRLTIPSLDQDQSPMDEYFFLQRYVLALFFFATGHESWSYNMNFLSGLHECKWFDVFVLDGEMGSAIFVDGVGCDGEPDIKEEGEWQKERIVTKLSFPPENNMLGSLPMELHHLQYLKELYIPLNLGITGVIPDEYGSFQFLETMVLTYTSLEGKIPNSFSSLKRLDELVLEYNNLSGNTVDGDLDFIRGLENLTALSLAYNANISGTLPEVISNLSKLQILSLSNNGFYGYLPSSLSSMNSLQYLFLDDNHFTGNLNVLKNMTNLTHLYLEDNDFNDTINDFFLSELKNLVHLDVSNNSFLGFVPGHFFKFSDLEVLDVSSNQLTGELPSDAMNVTRSNLMHLTLNLNNITGPIPSTIRNLINLTHLDLSSNQLSGEMTSEIGELINLDYLFLGRNNFNQQPFPEWLSTLTELNELSLKSVSLTGEIPPWLGQNLTSLVFLDLGENKLTGTLPPSFGDLTMLWVLILNQNQLNGTIPLSLSNFSNLEVLLLDSNDFTGNTDPLCNRQDMIKFFTADCASNATKGSMDVEIECECCTLCCNDENTTCNNLEWLGSQKSIWEDNYQRWSWDFEAGSVSPLNGD